MTDIQSQPDHQYVVDCHSTIQMWINDEVSNYTYRPIRRVRLRLVYRVIDLVIESEFRTRWSDAFLKQHLPTLGIVLAGVKVSQPGEQA